MSTLIKDVVIARVGKIIDGREITLSILERCVATFKPEYYQPNVVEHFDDVVRKHVARNKGKVISLKLEDGVLFADLEMYAPVSNVKKNKTVSHHLLHEKRKTENPGINERNSCRTS
ncbi:TPA: hypothetical protein ACWV46_002027 [Salmonella enterica subsp. enterica serovar Muenchen]